MKVLMMAVAAAVTLSACYSLQSYDHDLGCMQMSEKIFLYSNTYYKCPDGSEIRNGVRVYPDGRTAPVNIK